MFTHIDVVGEYGVGILVNRGTVQTVHVRQEPTQLLLRVDVGRIKSIRLRWVVRVDRLEVCPGLTEVKDIFNEEVGIGLTGIVLEDVVPVGVVDVLCINTRSDGGEVLQVATLIELGLGDTDF